MTFQINDHKIIDELYILFDNTEGLYHETPYTKYDEFLKEIIQNIKDGYLSFDCFTNYQIFSIHQALIYMINSKYYTSDINLIRAKILKYKLKKEVEEVKKAYDNNFYFESIFD